MDADECHDEGEGEESLNDIFDEINLFEYVRRSEMTAEAREEHERRGPTRDWHEDPEPVLSVWTRIEIRKAQLPKARVMSCPDREVLEGLPLPPWALEEFAAELVRLTVWPVVAEARGPGADNAWPPPPEPNGYLRSLWPLLEADIKWEVFHLPGGGRTIHTGPYPRPASGPRPYPNLLTS